MTNKEKFLIEITVEKSPTNEIEENWVDPENFVDYLQKYVLDEGASYGLDAYNKHAGQHIIDIKEYKKE